MYTTANRQSGDLGDTLSGVDTDVDSHDSYESRKERGVCTYYGCVERADEDCLLCPAHRRLQRERNRKSMARLRKTRREKSQCVFCGEKLTSSDLPARRAKTASCKACRIKRDRFRSAVVDSDVDRPDVGRWVERIEQSPDGVPRARRRFVGSGKRGRKSIESMDSEDLEAALRSLSQGTKGLAFARSQEVAQLPKVQRDDVKAQALAKLVSAGRWIVEVVKRHGYEIPIMVVDEGEDE